MAPGMRPTTVLVLLCFGGCATTPADGASSTASTVADAACTTRITYGAAWLPGANHPGSSDTVNGLVTWDGSCIPDGSNSYATLSNGWQPHFSGPGCVMALDSTCAGAPTSCATRVGYGPAWLAPSGHGNRFDDVADRIWPSNACSVAGAQSSEALSNGWVPYFSGSACQLSMRYDQCGGLYDNPVIAGNFPDPGVLHDGNQYVLVTTSGDAADAFPIRTSTDLVNWTAVGFIFPSGQHPSWAVSDFWAPEIHKVGSHYVAYYTARNAAGKLSIGAATASSATGPFTDLGQPLVTRSDLGVIDATEFTAADGTSYLVWKVDGNAVGQPTPIFGQPLSADGLTLTGAAVQLITNDRAWEGGVVEGPWVVQRNGAYWLFYSGNSYANSTYAVGVAHAASPLGPYTKLAAPIVTSNGDWIGPGHCSVVDGPSGGDYMVYHAWLPGHVNGPGDGRQTLVDRIVWSAGGPSLLGAPSVHSRPLP